MIENNVARGVQLYPGPSDVLIANNTIVGNGKAGIQFGDDTSNSLAVNNIIAYNGEYGIRSYNLSGAGNVVRRNLVWRNGSHNLAPNEGLATGDNLQAHPGFSANGSRRPSADSPAVGAALGDLAPGLDYDATARPLGAAPDLGAFEVG